MFVLYSDGTIAEAAYEVEHFCLAIIPWPVSLVSFWQQALLDYDGNQANRAVRRQRRQKKLGDIKSPKLIIAKGFLFLLLGVMASVILLLDVPTIKAMVLFAIAIWAFCRFYYFAFYVIQHYVDSEYRFDGLYSFLRYVLRSKAGREHCSDTPKQSGPLQP